MAQLNIPVSYPVGFVTGGWQGGAQTSSATYSCWALASYLNSLRITSLPVSRRISASCKHLLWLDGMHRKGTDRGRAIKYNTPSKFLSFFSPPPPHPAKISIFFSFHPLVFEDSGSQIDLEPMAPQLQPSECWDWLEVCPPTHTHTA